MRTADGICRRSGVMPAQTCSQVSLAVGETLPGTASEAARWLVVEQRAAWERDVSETPEVRELVQRFDGRVLMVRRPDRRQGDRVAFVAETTEGGGSLRRLHTLADLDGGDEIDQTLLLICCHGRRDPCCARLGPKVFAALRGHGEPDMLWQSSHHGGHRFAANVLALPAGIQLGRVAPGDAARVAVELAQGRVPLDHYRGRTLHPPAVQAADAAIRIRFDLRTLGDVRLLSSDGERVVFETPLGEVEATVASREGPPQPVSCGAASEPGRRYVVTSMAP